MSTARPVLALVVSAAAVLGLLTTAPAAQAVETVPRPASGVLELEGRGYGHGRGMSQWGAYGAADAGLAWRQVLDFYYPGTQRWTLPESPIRVWIGADTDNDTRVLPASGLSVTSGGATAVLPAGTQYDLWRVYRTSGGSLVLQRLDGSTWYQHPWPVTVGADATFTTSAGMVRLVRADGRSQDLRGGVRAVPYGTAPGLRTVAVLGMDQYLRSVVPAEMPASWPAEALRSQAVAARTYAARLRSDAGAPGGTPATPRAARCSWAPRSTGPTARWRRPARTRAPTPRSSRRRRPCSTTCPRGRRSSSPSPSSAPPTAGTRRRARRPTPTWWPRPTPTTAASRRRRTPGPPG